MSTATDLVTISDVTSELNWSSSQQTKYAAEMARFISQVTPVIERVVGPVVQRTFDEWYDGGRQIIQLNNTPVASVTSVTETYGSGIIRPLTAEPLSSAGGDYYGYTVDLADGLLVRRVHGLTWAFLDGLRNVEVVYVAGYCVDTASVPPHIAGAALEIIRDQWRPQQGGNRPGYAGNGEEPNQGAAGYWLTGRVLEMLTPSGQISGFA